MSIRKTLYKLRTALTCSLTLIVSWCSYAQSSQVWVDFDYPSLENGSISMPFDTLSESFTILNPGGTVSISAGSSHETLTIDTPVTLSAISGLLKIGDQSAPDGSDSPYEGLRITEIMYHPADGGAEYLELQNTGSSTLDVSGVYFSAGITFTFPVSTDLASGAYVVLVRDADVSAFMDVYPAQIIGGVYGGKLSNGGETISMNDPSHNTFYSITYNDVFPWPTGSDGLGFSLVAKNPTYPLSDSSNWRNSTV